MVSVVMVRCSPLHPLPPRRPSHITRYGPPPSYPNLKIPGLNAPIPEGASYGYHPGGWGKPPVDEFGRPLYGDVFGTADADHDEAEDVGVPKDKWGQVPRSHGLYISAHLKRALHPPSLPLSIPSILPTFRLPTHLSTHPPFLPRSLPLSRNPDLPHFSPSLPSMPLPLFF